MFIDYYAANIGIISIPAKYFDGCYTKCPDLYTKQLESDTNANGEPTRTNIVLQFFLDGETILITQM